MLYVKTDYTGGKDLTAGKLYPVNYQSECDYSLTYCIQDDSGYTIGVRVNGPSAHLEDIGIFKLYQLVEVE
jgi:hypothetical protein